MTPTAVQPRTLTEAQTIAANLVGRCFDRKEILKAAGLKRTQTISEWLNIPEFQEVVAQSNREYIAELREAKARIIRESLELVEKALKDAKSKTRVEMAYGIVRSVI